MKERMRKLIHIMGSAAALTMVVAMPVYAQADGNAQIKEPTAQEAGTLEAEETPSVDEDDSTKEDSKKESVEPAKNQEKKSDAVVEDESTKEADVKKGTKKDAVKNEAADEAPEEKKEAEPTEEAVEQPTILETDAWADKAAASVMTCANIRTEPTIESDRLGVLPRAGVATVVEPGEEWTKVQSGDITGYIRNDLLVFGEAAKQLYEETYGITGTVTAEGLRVRGDASLEAEQVNSLQEGEKVTLTGAEGDWYTVQGLSEGDAYTYAEYITVDEPEQVAMTEEEYYAAQVQAEQEAQQEAVQAGTASVGASGGELALLAAIIQCEAGGESYTGKVAVGAVVMNRVRSGSFPSTITDVIYQGGQFSPVASGGLSSVLSSGARSDCYEAAQAALNGENPVGGCLYFNSGQGRGIQIGNQHFY